MKDKLPRIVALTALVFLVGWPAMRLAVGTLTGEDGVWTLMGWREVFALPALPRAAWNTLLLASVSAFSAVLFGGAAAFLIARCGLPAPGLWRTGLAAPILFSQSVLAAAWVLLADRQGGLLNVLAERLGVAWRLNVFSPSGMALVVMSCVLPPAFLFLEAAFARMDPALEETAAVCGADARTILLRVTLPRAAPALGGASLISFLAAAAAFGPQAVLGLPSGIWTLPNLLYARWNLYSAHPASIAALAALLLTLGASVRPLLVRSRIAEALASPRVDAQTWPLGPYARATALVGLVLMVIIGAILPAMALLLRSLTPYGLQVHAPASEVWSRLNMDAWITVACDPQWRRAFAHSLGMAYAATVLSAAVGLALAALAARPGTRGATWVDAAASAPLGWSATALAVAISAAFGASPMRLGPPALMTLAYLIRELPLPYLAGRASVAGAPRALEEVALALGASPITAARVALWPAARPARAAAGAVVFCASFREIEASVLLAAPGWESFGASSYAAWTGGQVREMSAAYLIGAVLAGLGTATILWAGSIDRRQGEKAC